ncbi:MAG: ABC transporter permease [Desulfobacteraceae bacterium]
MLRLFTLPLVFLALMVMSVAGALILPLSPAGALKAASSSETLFALRLSLVTSLTATAAAFILGVPSGYVLARRRFPGKAVLDTFLDLPLVITPLIAGVGLLFLFGESGLGGALSKLGIQVLFTPLGAVAAQTFIAAPIITRSSRAAFESLSPSYEWAGQTLGLRPSQVFFKITLPMARHGILSGTVLAWARAVGEFGATLMVAGATRFRTETLPIAVYLNITTGELEVALSAALILMLAGFGMVLLLKALGDSAPDPISRKRRSA